MITVSRNKSDAIVLSRGFTDLLKFIAAILVALGHYSGYALTHSDNVIYKIIPMFAGNVGVAIFFFISGYGLMMSEKRKHLDFWPFVKRRLSKVYLPVVLVSFIWQLIIWPSGAGWERIPHLLYATFWGFSDGILWFVKAIMICYILFRVYLLFRKSIGGGIVSLSIGTALVYIIIYYSFASWAAISIPIFSLGILVADYNEEMYKIVRSWFLPVILLGIAAVMMGLYFWQGNLYLKGLLNWYVIAGILFLCAVVKIELYLPSWIGEISYDIYITHNKVINYLKPLYPYIGFLRFSIVSVLAAVVLHLIRKLFKI